MLMRGKSLIIISCLLHFLGSVCWAEELSIEVALTFREYYRWEGQTKEALRHVPIKEWSPYGIHPDFLDIRIRITNQSKEELKHLRATTRVIPRVGTLTEDKQFGFNLDRLHKTASWTAVYVSDEFAIDSLGPGKTSVKVLNNFNMKSLLDALFKDEKWATDLKVEVLVESVQDPRVKAKKAEALKIVPPSE